MKVMKKLAILILPLVMVADGRQILVFNPIIKRRNELTSGKNNYTNQ